MPNELMTTGDTRLAAAVPTKHVLALFRRLPLAVLRIACRRLTVVGVMMLLSILRSASSLADRLRLAVELLALHWSSEARYLRAHSITFGDAPRQPPQSPRRRRNVSTSCRLPVIEEVITDD